MKLERRAVFGLLAAFAVSLATALPARAHFLELLPSSDVLPDGGKVTLSLVFTHPMSRGPIMQLDRPARFGVLAKGQVVDLTQKLKAHKIAAKTTWRATHELSEPGASVFFAEPQPYWEPGEGKFIVHYTKVVVDAFASGEGWDATVGLPVEIEPLTRPSGLWTGNVFRGVVKKNGAAVPFATIEVEYVNDSGVKIPNDAFTTQVIKADGNGVFSYAMPKAGWWGFAALLDGDKKMRGPNGKDVPVELGGLMWVRTTDMN